ncbi:uncharacterized protein [Euwallacea fornicatus]|uniref:uncharacterized protein isoform X2 n=1 Tax=Euwallacea fornicatus TaxID=995702 RepID=UPI00338E234D
MYSTTLRGIFPEPKPVYRRNFVKENIKSIKHMQGILQEAGVIHPKKRSSAQEHDRNILQLTKSMESTSNKALRNTNKPEVQTSHSGKYQAPNKPSNVENVKLKVTKTKQTKVNKELQDRAGEIRLTHRAMQTEREEDMAQLYDSGVIKYPRPGIMKSLESPVFKSPQNGCGDELGSVVQEFENLTTQEDVIKGNKNIKIKASKLSSAKVMGQAPENYQRGIVPKYLRDRKEDPPAEIDFECPSGHILLPEEERKETLRVLRQSYADRIQELNMMPVRSDTLRMKKRKVEIEEELKRIDGGIKVFQRPKVYVKINA